MENEKSTRKFSTERKYQSCIFTCCICMYIHVRYSVHCIIMLISMVLQKPFKIIPNG